jgi:putative transcriptional regulator
MAKKVLRTVHETARDLFEIGAIGKVTMREYDLLCLPPVHPLDADEIRQVRKANQVSQAVFARFLGVGTSTVQQWEQGAKRPSSPALRLLELVRRKGLPALVEDLGREPGDVAPAS